MIIHIIDCVMIGAKQFGVIIVYGLLDLCFLIIRVTACGYSGENDVHTGKKR